MNATVAAPAARRTRSGTAAPPTTRTVLRCLLIASGLGALFGGAGSALLVLDEAAVSPGSPTVVTWDRPAGQV